LLDSKFPNPSSAAGGPPLIRSPKPPLAAGAYVGAADASKFNRSIIGSSFLPITFGGALGF